jgi:hypothetical protein
MTTKALTQHIVEDQGTRRQIFRVLISMLCVLSLAYVYFIGSITFNILARRTMESTMRENASRVNSLEVEYISLSNSIDVSSGLARGFVETRPTFATRTSLSTVAVR